MFQAIKKMGSKMSKTKGESEGESESPAKTLKEVSTLVQQTTMKHLCDNKTDNWKFEVLVGNEECIATHQLQLYMHLKQIEDRVKYTQIDDLCTLRKIASGAHSLPALKITFENEDKKDIIMDRAGAAIVYLGHFHIGKTPGLLPNDPQNVAKMMVHESYCQELLTLIHVHHAFIQEQTQQGVELPGLVGTFIHGKILNRIEAWEHHFTHLPCTDTPQFILGEKFSSLDVIFWPLIAHLVAKGAIFTSTNFPHLHRYYELMLPLCIKAYPSDYSFTPSEPTDTPCDFIIQSTPVAQCTKQSSMSAEGLQSMISGSGGTSSAKTKMMTKSSSCQSSACPSTCTSSCPASSESESSQTESMSSKDKSKSMISSS